MLVASRVAVTVIAPWSPVAGAFAAWANAIDAALVNNDITPTPSPSFSDRMLAPPRSSALFRGDASIPPRGRVARSVKAWPQVDNRSNQKFILDHTGSSMSEYCDGKFEQHLSQSRPP